MGCASNETLGFLCPPEKPCHELEVRIWQKAIDEISTANFPKEKFRGRVWTHPINSAWATADGTINITEVFLNELNGSRELKSDPKVVAVAAHEIAHIKLEHYKSDEWSKIRELITRIYNDRFPNTKQVDSIKINELAKSNEKLDMAADKEAITYLLKAGNTIDDYLNLLNWIQDNMINIEQFGIYTIPSSIKNRVKGVLAIKSENTDLLR